MSVHRFSFLSAATAILLGTLAAWSQETGNSADGSPGPLQNPYLFLISDPVVHRELQLSEQQTSEIRQLTDELHLSLWPLRNQSRAVGEPKLQQLIETAERRVNTVFRSAQRRRFSEIVLRFQGMNAFMRADLARELGLTDAQQRKIRDILAETDKAVADLQKQAQTDKSRQSLHKKAEQLALQKQKRVLAVLNAGQQEKWARLLGRDFDLSQLGRQVRFKAPDFQAATAWINSKPLKLADLRGGVVVVHFYTYG